LRSSRAGARRDIVRRFQIGSTAHDPHRPVATLQCCSQSPLLVDRRRACSANDHSHAPARSRSHDNRNSFIASPGSATTLSRGGPHLAVTTATPQPIARASQIPIAPARRTVLPMPARGFLPRGLSDACPRSAPHCLATGRHLITLNDSGPSRLSPPERRGSPRAAVLLSAGHRPPVPKPGLRSEAPGASLAAFDLCSPRRAPEACLA